MTHRWGEQTALAIANFPISGEPMPVEIVRAIIAVKAAAATVNEQHGLVDPVIASTIRAACAELLADPGMAAHFPVDVFQTGSGTSTNMNVNEVLATMATARAGRLVHPNDHVNASQSSNDVIPSAIRIAVAAGLVDDLLPAVIALGDTLSARAVEFDDTVTLGRTHLMDAAPVTFGQQLGGWARMAALGVDRVRDALGRLTELPLGGSAVGTGLNTPPGFGREMAALLGASGRLEFREASDHFEAQSTQDALVDASAACRTLALSLHKMAGDLRLLGSGPYGGFGEVELPALQAGSSIMPGKVNPVIPEVVQQVAAQVVGNDATVVFASTMSTLQLNTAMPVIGRAMVSTVRLVAAAARVLDEKCVRGLTVNATRMRQLAERSASITMTLVPSIGYDAATRVAKTMVRDDLSLAEALRVEGVDLDVTVDVLDLARGGRHAAPS